MTELFNDFMLIERLPDGNERVFILSKQVSETGLKEGDEVLLVEEDNLRAIDRLQHEEGRWYGLVVDRIEDISVDAPSSSPQTRAS